MTAPAISVAARLPMAAGVCLTFDDGPDPRWTSQVLDILAQAQLCATFFVVGKLARQQAQLVRRIANAGHALGNHSWSHRHPWLLSQHAARREVQDGAAAIADVVGAAVSFFRPPHGRLRRCMVEQAQATGQELVLWRLSAIDWGPLGAAPWIMRRLERTRPGDIVLMHDGGWGINRPAELVQVLPQYLATLQRRAAACAAGS